MDGRTFFTPARLARLPAGGLGPGVLERRSLLKIFAASASFFLRARAARRLAWAHKHSVIARGRGYCSPSWIIFSKSAAILAPSLLPFAAMVRNGSTRGGNLRMGVELDR